MYILGSTLELDLHKHTKVPGTASIPENGLRLPEDTVWLLYLNPAHVRENQARLGLLLTPRQDLI